MSTLPPGVFCTFHRKPKVEKTKPDKEAGQQQVLKKKKGFLPETKKRKKRNKPILEPAVAAVDNLTSTEKTVADKGQAKKKHDKKTKQKRRADGAMASQPNPAKKSKMQSESKMPSKKSRPRKLP